MKLRNMATIYISNNDEILMMFRTGSRVFKGSLWVGIGGHFENDELNEPEKCVLRELFEETGITNNDIVNLSLKYITIRKANEEIRQQYIYFADLSNKNINILHCDEGDVSWLKISEISQLKMSFTNEECLKHYFEIGKYDDGIYSGTVKVINDIPTIEFISLKDFITSY